MQRRDAALGGTGNGPIDQQGREDSRSGTVGEEERSHDRGDGARSRRGGWRQGALRAGAQGSEADWLVVLNPAGRIVAVEGGVPGRWVGSLVTACDGMDEALRQALATIAAEPLEATPSGARHQRVPALADRPEVDVLVVEGVWLHPLAIGLSDLVRVATDPFVEEAAAQGVQLDVSLDGVDGARVLVDQEKVAWSIGALVAGALRHVRRGSEAMPGGRIAVRVTCDGLPSIARITVEDDGCGMEPRTRDALLQGGWTSRGHTLRLVHEIAEAHGGGLVVRSSTAPADRGTTTTLLLPLSTD